MSRLYSALLMLGNAVLVFVALWLYGELEPVIVSGAVAAAVLVGLAGYMSLSRGDVAVFLARGVAIVLLVAVLGSTLLSAMAAQFGNVAMNLRPREWVIDVALVVLQLALLWVTRPKVVRRITVAALSLAGGVAMAVVLVLASSLALMSDSLVDRVLTIPRLHADSILRTTIPRVQACAIAFARQRDGSYPPSLAAMGPAGTNCLDPEAASGRIGSVLLAYRPLSADEHGRFTHYEVTAMATGGIMRGDLPVAHGDEAGVVRRGDVHAPPESFSIIAGGMRGIRAVRACAEVYRSRDVAGSYPGGVDSLYGLVLLLEDVAAHAQLGCVPSAFPGFGADAASREVGTYTPLGDPDRPTDYLLEIRPRVYGVHGVRSLRTTARGPVHATVEDRPATVDDPIVEPCGFEHYEPSCAP